MSHVMGRKKPRRLIRTLFDYGNIFRIKFVVGAIIWPCPIFYSKSQIKTYYRNEEICASANGNVPTEVRKGDAQLYINSTILIELKFYGQYHPHHYGHITLPPRLPARHHGNHPQGLFITFLANALYHFSLDNASISIDDKAHKH